MPSLFDVQMRENELLNPNARSYREVGTPEFERELDAMVQSRAGAPQVTQGGGGGLLAMVMDKQARENASGRRVVGGTDGGVANWLGQPIQSEGSVGTQLGQRARDGLLAAKDFARGVTYPFRAADQYLNETAMPAAQEFGQEFVASATDTPISPLENIDIDSIPARKEVTSPNTDEELLQQASDTMSSIKQGDLSNPQAAAQAAQVVKEDASTKGASINIEKPEGMEASAWESFNDQFDLTTIGLTLLATNSNGQNLAANLGYAMQAGRAAKQVDGAKARKTRKEEADIMKTESEILAAAQKFAGGTEAEQESRRLDDEYRKAATKALAAKVTGEYTGKAITGTQQAVEQAFIGGIVGEDSKDVPKDIADAVAIKRLELRSGYGITNKKEQDGELKLWLEAEQYLTPDRFFAGRGLTSAADRLGE